ncbi:MAG: hypothetical protein IJH25_05770, partial [Clostridia bacterium]|nr:hypothetical protein [Clostridia bacterium]
AQYGGTSGGAFSDICCLQISRFTASKPSKSAIASVEKFTRQLTTLIARYFLKEIPHISIYVDKSPPFMV